MGEFAADAFRHFRASFKHLLLDDGGQATVEYVLILLVAVVGGTSLVRVLVRTLDRGVLRFGSQLEMDLKTGRVPIGVWGK